MAPRPVPSGLLESDRAISGPFTGGLICANPAPPGLRAAAGIFAGGSRPEKHAERGLQCESSLAGVRFDECVLRLGVYERDAGRAISRRTILPQHTTFDLSFGKSFREKYSVSVNSAECGESPRAAGQQLDVRRIPLQRSAADLRRVAISVSLLGGRLRKVWRG